MSWFYHSSRRYLYAISAGALLAPAVARAQMADPPRAVVTSATVVGSNGTVTVVSEPAERFASARAALAAHRPAQAAVDIRDAATFVRGQATMADGTIKADLLEAARDLDAIAARVRNGTLKTPRDLDAALRRSDRGLARHHLERATRAWERRDSQAAGRELRAAAQYTERLAQDAGIDVRRATKKVVRDARTASGKLEGGGRWTADEVGKAFKSLGGEIDRLGADISSRR